VILDLLRAREEEGGRRRPPPRNRYVKQEEPALKFREIILSCHCNDASALCLQLYLCFGCKSGGVDLILLPRVPRGRVRVGHLAAGGGIEEGERERETLKFPHESRQSRRSLSILNKV
jgi:hypothetical protein